MIHYIDGKPYQNITFRKPKRHAVAHYRHLQRVALLKDTAARFAIVLAAAGALAAVYLIRTA